MTIKYSLSVALLAVSLAAQAPPPKCKIAGQLTNSVTNEPIRKAKVSLHPDDETKTVYTVETDASGKFRLENIDPGRYTLEGEKAGFVAGWYGATRPEGAGSEIDLKSDKETADLTLKLIPQGIIGGRVLDDEGEPVAGVMVMALHYMYMNGHKQLVPVPGAMQIQTNDLGEYRLSSLPPGRYYVQSSAMSMAAAQLGMLNATEKPQGNTPEEALVPVFYPNSPDPASASPIQVGAGAEVRGMDLRLKKSRVVRVSGKLVDSASGEPLKGGVVMLYRRTPGAMAIVPSAMSVSQGGKGEFEVRNLAPGDYNVMTMATFDPSNMKMTMSRMQVGDQAVKDFVIKVGAGADIPVTARLAAGVTGDLSNIHVMLQVDDNPMASLANTPIGKDGTGSLKRVSPDKYRVTVVGVPQNTYLLSARMGNVDILESGLDLRDSGNAAAPLELIVGGPAAKISGTVKNDKGELVPGAIVTVIAKDPKQRTDMKHTGTTDQNGHFLFTGLVPSEYRVYAWEDIEQGAGEDPDFIKPFEKMRVDADLSQTSATAAPLDLKLITRAAVLEAQSQKQ